MKDKEETRDTTSAMLIAVVGGAIAALFAFGLYIVTKAKSIINKEDKPK